MFNFFDYGLQVPKIFVEIGKTQLNLKDYFFDDTKRAISRMNTEN